MSRLAEILGVEDEEEFTTDKSNVKLCVLPMDGTAYLMAVSEGREYYHISSKNICDIINGKIKIVKLPKRDLITDDEKECLNYYAKRGFHWFAKDKYGEYNAYAEEPFKRENYEMWDCKVDERCTIIVEQDLSFLSWEDEEPFYWEGENE